MQKNKTLDYILLLLLRIKKSKMYIIENFKIKIQTENNSNIHDVQHSSIHESS